MIRPRRRYSRVRGGPISGRLVHEQIKLRRPSIQAYPRIDLEPDRLDRFRLRRCRPGAACLKRDYRKVAAIQARMPKIKAPFIGDWGFELMMKRLRQRKRKPVI